MKSFLINKSLLCASAMLVALTFSMVCAQTHDQNGDKPGQSGSSKTEKQEADSTVVLPVKGSGTAGQLTKWIGFSPVPVIGDSIVTETSGGNIGIGTVTPTSKLTVTGTIESTLGGYKFPDGTLQTTAGLASVFHDTSLKGSGAATSPLGIAAGGVNTVHLATGAVTGPNIANGSVVRSLNGLFDSVNLAAGANVTLTPAGNTLTIAAPNTLTSVARDQTLTGNGSSSSPLGVANQGIGTAQIADNAVTAGKLAPAQVLKSLNGLTDNVNITTDSNLMITPLSNSLMISAPNLLSSIAHDASLSGNGTSASPLSAAVVAAPTQQPVAFGDRAVINAGGSNVGVSGPNIYTVPQGQRLVIQQVMATVDNNFSTACAAGLMIDYGFTTEFGLPDFTAIPIVLTEQKAGMFAPFPSSGTPDTFAGSQAVTIYLQAGETVQFEGLRSGTNGISSFRWFFYGYLVPAP